MALKYYSSEKQLVKYLRDYIKNNNINIKDLPIKFQKILIPKN